MTHHFRLAENNNYSSYTPARLLQRWTLATLYEALYGKEWSVRSGWMRNTNECTTWYGIVCDDTSMVTSIEISENNLWGYLPPEIGLLVNVGELYVCLVLYQFLYALDALGSQCS